MMLTSNEYPITCVHSDNTNYNIVSLLHPSYDTVGFIRLRDKLGS